MAALEVIHVDVVADGLASLPDVAVLREIGFLILECPEPPLNLDVVGPAALAIHALADVVFLEESLVLLAGELASLVGVENLRLCYTESLPYGGNDHPGVQGIVHLPANNAAAVPVDDGCQINETVLQGDVGDVDGPCLVRLLNIHMLQQVGHHLRLLLPLGKVHLRIDGVDAHLAHVASCLASSDLMPEALQLRGQLPCAPGRIVRVETIDDALAFQLFI